MRRILVATDGSASSTDGVRLGIELAAAEGAQLIVAHVVPTIDVVPSTAFGIGGAFSHEPTEDDFAILEDAAALAAEHGVRSTTLLLRGDTVTELLACADDRDVDLIVLGCRGRGSLATTFLGSVSREVLRAAKRPVLIAPPRRTSGEIVQPAGGVGLGF